MSGTDMHMRTGFIPVSITLAFVLLIAVAVPSSHAESAKPPASPRDNYKLGERMYRDGILPSGEPIPAFVKGDVPVSGSAFSCVSCHMRSGLGSFEGGVITSPTNGAILYKPDQVNYKNVQQKYFPLPPRRPAYDDKSLAEVIRSGVNPAGAVLNDVMPRYMIENEDMEILVAYLKALSKDFSPGVTDSTIHFATVIAGDVPPESRDAMLAPLQGYVDNKNNLAQFYETQKGGKSRLMVEKMLASKELATRRLTLSQWVLKGPPETWRRQLDDYYRKEPVFALLGGITSQDWQVIHNFSEENKIPCLLPHTEFPEVTASDWYTLYPSKGYYQEGEAAARYLKSREDIPPDRPVVQIVRDSREGKALSSGFEQTWRNLGRREVVTARLKADEKLTGVLIERLLTEHKPSTLMIWDGPDVLPALETISAASKRPELVFMSARYLGRQMRSVPVAVRDFTYITYPFSFAQKQAGSAMGKVAVEDDSKWSILLKDAPDHDDSTNASQLSNSITQVLTMGLMDMRGNYYRDNFFDVISMVPDQTSPLFGRMSFGPNQRYASKGCYIVQITKGQEPELVRKSDWVIH